MNIIVLDGFTLNPGDISWERIASQGNFTVYDRTAPEQTVERIGTAEVIFTNKTVISADVMDKCPNLKYIGVLATGYNVIDLAAAKKHGITVTNIPGYSTPAVAQFVFALILEICCHVQAHSDSVKAGEWITSKDFAYWKYPLVELAGKTLGIYGYGSIGSAVAKTAQTFGMNVICHTRTPSKIPADSGVTAVSADELFARSDIITLHSPLTPQTENLINAASIAKMKDGVIIINTARGPLVNEADMRKALDSGKVGAFGADVISKEPMENTNPLLGAKNCILPPHIAWATKEARTRLMNTAADNLAAFLKGAPVNTVG